MRDAIGARGEALFYVIMTKFHGRRGPLFKPQFLGDKWPTVDFIVELERSGAVVPYFFVQVKSTRQGYSKRDRRLLVSAEQEDVRRLASFPAPTYIVGIDERKECGYIVSANGENVSSLSSLSTSFQITGAVRQTLWNEVAAYWSAAQPPALASAFVDFNWK